MHYKYCVYFIASRSIRSIMKALTLVLIAVIVGRCSSYLIKFPTSSLKPTIAPVGWVHIQKLLLPLFENVCEDSNNEIVAHLAKEFSLVDTNGEYKNSDVVEKLRNIKTVTGFLPKGEIFSEYNTSHLNELKALYDVFYYAEDFNTFYKAACWARQNLNCGIFIDALYTAILSRRDTSKISIPAPYELIPNYFIRKDVIIKAASLLAGIEIHSTDNVRVENNAYILDADYTTDANDDDDDSKLAYFREDIGLNSYYFLRKLRSTLWVNTTLKENNYYGEHMFEIMKQIAARYDLERYSNGLPELQSVKWDSVGASYNPLLIYSNGKDFCYRTFSGKLGDSDDAVFLKTIENNIATVVTHLRQAGYNKSQILNHLIEILTTSAKNYESVAQRLLSSDMEMNERQYSVLEHYLTTVRDPVYWKIIKKMVELIDDGLKVLPRYTRKELYFPGLEILNIDTKKMVTSFDVFQFDVTDSLKRSTENTTYRVKIEQKRLSHKPFALKLNISSLAMQKGQIKIYLGPRIMPGELTSRKNLFMQIDKFDFDFKRGINIISRSSQDMKSFSDDFISLQELHRKIEDAEFGLDSLSLKEVEMQIKYPARLILPKGLSDGMPLQIFVFVAPFYKNIVGSLSSISREFNTAILSPGYPLDLPVDSNALFNLPNALIKDIIITHKDELQPSSYGSKTVLNKYDSNKSYISNPYSTNDKHNYAGTYDNTKGDYYSGSKVEYEGQKLINEDYSYMAKRNQYKKKENWAVKQDKYKNQNIAADILTDEKIIKPTYKINDHEITNENSNIFDNDNYDVKDKIHGLLDSHPKLIYENKNKNQYNEINNYLPVQPEHKNYGFDNKNGKQINENPKLLVENKSQNKDYNQIFVDNVHGLLGNRSDFTYKKNNNFNYTGTINQYKNRKEEYDAKRSQYKKYNNPMNESILINSEQSQTKKLNDDNGIYQNINEDKLNSNDNFDKRNTGKSEFKDLLSEKQKFIYLNAEKREKTPRVVTDTSKIIIERDNKETNHEFTFEPITVAEYPKRRITVYDYLFNFDAVENRVYE